MKFLKTKSIVAAIAVASATSTGGAMAQDAKTFALVQVNQQALFFNEMNRGAEEEAKKLGAELLIYNANNDPAAQNSAIETYIQQGVDGIAVAAIDVNGIMPAVEEADAANIPVAAIDAILDAGGGQIAQVGVDNAKAAASLAEFYNREAGEGAKIGIVGALNSYIQNVRLDGFKDALGDGITISDTVDGQNVQDVAMGAAENLLTANPDLTAIYATGEPALIGAIAAVESQGRQDSVKIYGWDLSGQAIAGIDSGFVSAVVQQNPAGMGAAAIAALDKVTSGDTIERQVDVPVTIVTSENVDDFRSLFE